MPRQLDPRDDRESLADAEIASYVTRAQAQARAYERLPALSAFQKQMERYPQLSPLAQNELAADYQAGVAARAELASGRLRGAPERRARAKVRRGEYAIEHLIGSNFKLVHLICRENAEDRFGRERANELLPDLVAEANLALTEAAGSFDPARCPTFPTYAARVVRDRVRMVLSRDSAVKLAPSWTRLKRIASVRIPQLSAELGRRPTKAEIQADLLERCLEWAEGKLTDEQRSLPPAQRHDIKLAKLRKQGMLGAIEALDDVLVATQSVTSLSAPVGADGSATVGDLIAADSDDATFDSVELSELRESLAAALATLKDRDREIVLYRYGFVDGECWTYAKIATRYGVTAERVRQIERSVITRLAVPHSQYAALAAHLPSQFEDLDGD